MASRLLLHFAGLGLLVGPALAADPSPRFNGIKLTGENTTGPISGACVSAMPNTTCRTLRDRAADTLNVKDRGAQLTGADDSSAFQAARAAAPRNGVLMVPPGCINVTVPTDAAKTVLWNLSGNTYCGGTVPVAGIGSDIVETFLPDNGGKFFGQTSTTTNSRPLTTFQRTVNHSGGGGGVLDTVRVNTNVAVTAAPYIFGLTSVMEDNSPGTNLSGNYVAGYLQYNRRSGAVPGWGLAVETNDFTNTQSSASAPLLGAEILLRTNRADDSNRRIVLDLVLGQAKTGSAFEGAGAFAFVRAGNFLGDLSQGSSRYGFTVEAPITQVAYNAADAKFVGAVPVAFRAGNGAYVDLSSDATKMLRWQPRAGLQYYQTGKVLFGVPDAGGFVMPDTTAPTSRTDSTGVTGEVRFNADKMYRKTTSGWYSVTMTPMQ